MMNNDNKVMNALVNLMVCPRHPGTSCCGKCSYRGTESCYENLISDSMTMLHAHFGAQVSAKAAPDYAMQVTNVMREIGIPAHVLGYKYARRAILLAIGDDMYVNAVTKYLYPTIAKEFNTTASRVERAIRHAIEVAWSRGDLDVLMHYFGNTIDRNKGKPTNTEFIAAIAEHLKLVNGVDSSK